MFNIFANKFIIFLKILPCIDLIRLLVRHGADPNEKDNEGIAIIDLAKDDATRQVLKEAIHYAASKNLK